MTLDTSQLGKAGELALTLYALITSEGEVELYSPVVDDDHVDLVGAIRGGLPVIGLQVKTEDHLDKDGQVEGRASYPAGTLREDPAFLYAVLLLQSVQIRAAWLIPSPDFNRLAYRTTDKGREVLAFRAYPDRQDRYSGPGRSAARTGADVEDQGYAIGPRVAGHVDHRLRLVARSDTEFEIAVGTSGARGFKPRRTPARVELDLAATRRPVVFIGVSHLGDEAPVIEEEIRISTRPVSRRPGGLHSGSNQAPV